MVATRLAKAVVEITEPNAILFAAAWRRLERSLHVKGEGDQRVGRHIGELAPLVRAVLTVRVVWRGGAGAAVGERARAVDLDAQARQMRRGWRRRGRLRWIGIVEPTSASCRVAPMVEACLRKNKRAHRRPRAAFAHVLQAIAARLAEAPAALGIAMVLDVRRGGVSSFARVNAALSGAVRGRSTAHKGVEIARTPTR